MGPVVALPTLRSHPRCPPRLGLHGACFLRARSCGPSRTLSPLPPHLAALTSGGGRVLSAPPYLHPPPLGGRRCVRGGGNLVVTPSLHTCRRYDASTAQARGAAPVPLLGGEHALWLPSSPFLPCVRTPGGPPSWGLHGACSLRTRSCGPSSTLSPLPPHPAALSSGGGRFSPPPYLHPPPLGGRRSVCGGGGLSSSLRSTHDASMAQARGAALVPLQGGGLLCVTRRRPSYPACAPPGGRRCVWGGGRPCRRPFVACMSQARRKHDASTG